jgi:dihydroorotase
VVDGGSRGAANIQDMLDVAAKAPNRVRLLINVARPGNITVGDGENINFANIDVAAAREAIRRNRELIVGVKARLSRQVAGTRDIEVLKKAQQITQPFGIPVMIHMGETYSPLPEILKVLRRGDIVSHVYAPDNGILDASGRVLAQVREARRRGVLFDVGHGRTAHITWEVAERALQQDFPPDTITSDLNGAGLTDQVFDFPNILSKFILLGMTLEQVIACGTVNAARAIPALKDLGTLKTGAIADISVLELADGNFEFVDNRGSKRPGTRKLIPRAAVVAGKPWRPAGA